MREQKVVTSVHKTMAAIEYSPLVESKELLFYLISAGYYQSLYGYDVKRSGYDTILLIYTISGSGKLEYLDKKYTILPGSAMIIDCSSYHNYSASEEGWQFYWMHFSGKESRKIIRSILDSGGPYYTDMDVKDIMEQVFILGDRPSKKSDILINLRINELLTKLMLRSGEYYHTPYVVDKAIKFIESHSNADISLDDLSSYCNISKFHLSRMFKNKIGMSPYEYLINYRLSQAKQLLVTTEEPVCQIANSVGFHNLSGFMRHFKNNERCTPLKYRQMRG